MAEISFTLEDRKLLWKLARGIEKYHLTIPAIMYLEMHKPLAFVMSSFLLTLRPIAFLFMNDTEYTKLAEMLEKRSAVEELLSFLEFAAKNEDPFANECHDDKHLQGDPIHAGVALHSLETLHERQIGKE